MLKPKLPMLPQFWDSYLAGSATISTRHLRIWSTWASEERILWFLSLSMMFLLCKWCSMKKNTLILRYLLRRNCLLDHMFCSHFCNVLYLSCYLTLWTSGFDFVFVFVTQGLSAEVVWHVDDCGCGPGDNEIARAVHWNNQRKWYLHCRSNPPVHYTVPQSPTVHSATTTYQCISAFLQSYQHFCHYRLINGNNGKNFRNLLLYPWIWDL